MLTAINKLNIYYGLMHTNSESNVNPKWIYDSIRYLERAAIDYWRIGGSIGGVTDKIYTDACTVARETVKNGIATGRTKNKKALNTISIYIFHISKYPELVIALQDTPFWDCSKRVSLRNLMEYELYRLMDGPTVYFTDTAECLCKKIKI
jgi:hypothetical protein